MALGGPQSLSSLLRRTALNDHDEILRACNTVLTKNRGDSEAQHAKVVALLKLDRFEEAEHFFDEVGEKLISRAKLEYAYTLYKVGKLQDAVAVPSQIEGSREADHVAAQSV